MQNVRAKKFLGQHFLKNEKIALKIVELLSKETKHVLEIGPGMGVLTKYLLENEHTTLAIEIDRESVDYLKSHYKNLTIINDDFLKINLAQKFAFKFSLIGNFPYNISSQILFQIFENKDQIIEIVGMFQKEVAERIACKKGKKRGILSVLIQTYYNVEYCFSVEPHMFAPPPKVNSGVIKLIRNQRKDLKTINKKFKQIVKMAFNQKRKTIKNSLKSLDLEKNKNIQNLLNLRAEQLKIDDFILITKHAK
jgi:16S rRNA (adenine1518-N6/adenine1519-N6)-dimethyltransferase